MSMFTNIVVSVVAEVGKGWANLPIAKRFCASSYNPTVVTYGENYEPVTLSFKAPSASRAERFRV